MSLITKARDFLDLIDKKKTDYKDQYLFKYFDKSASVSCKKNNYPELTQNDIDDINKFWSKYGIKFPDYSWFKMFYAETGIHDPRFIPHSIAFVLYPCFNNRIVEKGWDDKNFYDRFVPAIRFPESLCHYVNGYFHDSE